MNQENTILLTALGTQNYQAARYAYNGKFWETCFAPVATLALAFDRDELARTCVSVVGTKTALDRSFENLAAECRHLGVRDVRPQTVPEASTPDDITKILVAILDAVPVETQPAVAVDLTFGLRHQPVLYLAALAYLVGLRDLSVRGLYYGAFELRGADGTCPIIDVTPFFELLQWYQALAALRETGRAQSLAKALRSHVRTLFVRGSQKSRSGRHVSIIRDAAEALAPVLAYGLPIEAGLAARNLLDALQQAETRMDAAVLAAQGLAETVQSWAVAQKFSTKHEVPLDEAELRRQWQFIEWASEHFDYANALEAMREWVVNVILWRRGNIADWLDYRNARKPAERFLSALSYRAKCDADRLSDLHRDLAAFWDKISEQRNLLAHAGMKKERVRVTPEGMGKLLALGRSLLDRASAIAVHFPARSRLLIAPLGRSPGALFSALRHVQPDSVLVLTSKEAAENLGRALQAASVSPTTVATELFDDPYQAFREADQLAERTRGILLEASEVIVNLTGGTTALQYLAERLADEALRLGTTVCRVAVMDRRSREEQQRDPFQLGEIAWLDRRS